MAISFLRIRENFNLTDATMERVRSGEENVLSLDEVERDLGLED